MEDFSEKKLLQLIVCNQIKMFQHLERIHSFLVKQNPKNGTINKWKHKDKIYEEFLKNMETTFQQIRKK